jgi:hypothetical protein
MIGQVLTIQGATVAQSDHTAINGRTINLLRLAEIDTVLIAFLNSGSKAHARQAVRRLKRQKPSLRVGIVMTGLEGQPASPVAAADIDADFVVTTITDAVRNALTDAQAVEIKAVKRIGRTRESKSTPLVA